ncbi:MAG TPA: nucleoside deaminase [Candidatus Onthovivens sp.]|nr:nucleoside deaminase [Candidatus Onthovivens sp.]
MIKTNEYYMNLALKEAKKASKKKEVPVGAILVDESGKIIAKAHNKRTIKSDVSAHAEVLVLRKAAKKVKEWRLPNLTLFVTLEPCLMCASAIVQSRIKEIVIGAQEFKSGSFGSTHDILKLENYKMKVERGILEKESLDLLKKFFKELRN